MNTANVRALQEALTKHLTPGRQLGGESPAKGVAILARALAEEGAVMAGALTSEDLGAIVQAVGAMQQQMVSLEELVITLKRIAIGEYLPPGTQ